MATSLEKYFWGKVHSFRSIIVLTLCTSLLIVTALYGQTMLNSEAELLCLALLGQIVTKKYQAILHFLFLIIYTHKMYQMSKRNKGNQGI